MALILNIDTAVQTSSICLANGKTVLGISISPSERNAATWLHTAIQELLFQNNTPLSQLAAIAISAGPGSYTGLRVGMAAAKGLCYALSLPLITVPTLQMMAASVKASPGQLLCPMIDARRMEVFTALYDGELREVMPATNLILEEDCFGKWLAYHTIFFFGNGSEKAKLLLKESGAQFVTTTANAANMVRLSADKFERHQFSNLAYIEPFYGKEFHSPVSTKKY